MADNDMLASLLGYVKRAPGAAVDWLAGGAKSGADPTLALMRGDAADQPFLPTADSGGRLGAIASALSGPMMPIKAPSGGAVLGAGPTFRTAEKALDMSPEARAARAAEQGYEGFQRPWLHGSPGDITAFDPAKAKAGNYGKGVYVTRMPGKANGYAGQTGAVYPLAIKKGNQLDMTVPEGSAIYRDVLDRVGNDRVTAELANMGYDSLRAGGETVVFDPAHVRSRNAAFDPAKAGSSDLLASRAPLPAIPQTEEQKRAAIAELLRNGGA